MTEGQPPAAAGTSAAGTGHLVLVGGYDAGDTGMLAGLLHDAGHHLPQPELEVDVAEGRRVHRHQPPQWTVDTHDRLLRARGVAALDPRPDAWERTSQVAGDERVAAALRAWLAVQLVGADVVVVNDPRTVWFLPSWERAAAEVGVALSYVLVLRRPAEPALSAASHAAGWLNVMLQGERRTRMLTRAVVDADRLDRDGPAVLGHLGTVLGLPSLEARRAPTPGSGAAPGADVRGPLAEQLRVAWERLRPLTAPGGDTAAARAALDVCWDDVVAPALAHAAPHDEPAVADSPAQVTGSTGQPPVRRRVPQPMRGVRTRSVRLARRGRGRVARTMPLRWRLRLREAARDVRTLTRRRPQDGGW